MDFIKVHIYPLSVVQWMGVDIRHISHPFGQMKKQ